MRNSVSTCFTWCYMERTPLLRACFATFPAGVGTFSGMFSGCGGGFGRKPSERGKGRGADCRGLTQDFAQTFAFGRVVDGSGSPSGEPAGAPSRLPRIPGTPPLPDVRTPPQRAYDPSTSRRNAPAGRKSCTGTWRELIGRARHRCPELALHINLAHFLH